MAELVLMTALSPTMEEGTIASWSKKEGDTVETGDVLCEVETDKATMEYEATQEGTLLKVIVPEGGSARVGGAIGVLGEKGEDYSALVADAAAAANAPPAAEASEKSEPDSPPEVIGREEIPPARDPVPKGPVPRVNGSDRVRATPVARKIAAARNVDLSLIAGSGPEGRITKADVEDFRGVPASGGRLASAQLTAAVDQKIPVSRVRGVIARRLSESKFSAPHYYLKSSVDMAGVVRARKVLNSESGDKVSFNAFLIKYAAEALKRHPEINASWQETEILQFGSYDIGLAVDVGNGLITPIVRDCGNKGVAAIDAELKDLIERAGSGALAPEEYTGATFTISNLGSFGIDEFTAIINPPGSAILAVGKTTPTPIVDESGAIAVANLMKITLSCDHRVIDGAAGARFLSDLKMIMEDPARLVF